MGQGSTRRAQHRISYAESEASQNRSPFNTPPSQRPVIDLDENDDMEGEEVRFTASRTREGLRLRKPNQSLKFRENGETTTVRPRSKKRSAIEEVYNFQSHLSSPVRYYDSAPGFYSSRAVSEARTHEYLLSSIFLPLQC